MNLKTTVTRSPTLQVNADLGIRLLALVVEPNGDEAYRVSFRTGSNGPFVAGLLIYVHGNQWDLSTHGIGDPTRFTWTTPDEVFALALGPNKRAVSRVQQAAPHWPTAVVERLQKRRLSGPGTVAFDAGWFLAELATSALDHPLLLPNAASKLGLADLQQAADILSAVASGGLVDLLMRAVDAERPNKTGASWGGEGRLIGAFHGGELAQIGTNIHEGCRAALGSGPLSVTFAASEPLGLGLGPLFHTDNATDHSAGLGCRVGEVAPGEAAERAGVRTGMPLSHLSDPHLDLTPQGAEGLSFEAVLDAIDTRRSMNRPLALTFDSATPATHLYAVEMPAALAVRALSATLDEGPQVPSRDVGVGASLNALCGRTLVWRETTPRLFLGEAGSGSSVHTDMCPQVQMAHALFGTKLLGVASHDATPRLSAEHANDDGDLRQDEATSVATDRPLTTRAGQLLCDPEMSLAVARPGDLVVFHSGALHFASNGAETLSGAVYHGLITLAAVPRLREAAAAQVRSRSRTNDRYSGHLFAPELLRLVERQLAAHAKADRRKRTGGRGKGRRSR